MSMTDKQITRHQFFKAVENWHVALESGKGIAEAGLSLHIAKTNVPKSYWCLITAK